MPIVKCETCGKEFDKLRHEIARRKYHYCCRKCYHESTKNPINIIIKDDYAEINIKNRANNVITTLIDLDDLELIKNISMSPQYDKTINGYYIRCLYNKESTSLHRAIMDCPSDMQVDHINHDTLDNRKCNLRICTNKQNSENKKVVKSKSGHRNIYWNKRLNKWEISLGINGKSTYFGVYSNLEDAITVAKKAREENYTHATG